MSHRRTPFQFNPDLSSDERRSEILRRFGFQPEEDNMFYETNSPSWSTDWASRFHRPGFYDDPEWRNTGSVFGNSGSGPGSPQTRLRRGWTADHDDGGVPIKVVHEGSSGAARGFHDDGDAASETSSQGSRSSCSSGRSGGASSSKTRHEPRVHHIPIMVEPRVGSSSSGYNSDGELRQGRKVSADHAAAGEPKYAHTVPIEVDGRAAHGHPRRPPQDTQDQEMTDGSENVRVIPIEVDYGGEARARCKAEGEMNGPATGERSWAQTFPRQKSQEASKNTAPPSKSSSSGKLGRKGGTSSAKGGSNAEPQQQEDQGQKQQKHKAEEQLRQIEVELGSLRQKVLAFEGKPQDKQYKYLDEMLTRLMLKLDVVDPAGDATIRQLRKSMIKEVEQVINRLEGKPPTDALVEIDKGSVVEVCKGTVVEGGKAVAEGGKAVVEGGKAVVEAEDDEADEGSLGALAEFIPNGSAAAGAKSTGTKVPGGKSDTSGPGNALANPSEQSPKSEYISFNETSSDCKSSCYIQKDEEAKETPMETEAAVSSEAQPSQHVQMPPAIGGEAGAQEVSLPELPAIPMPVDLDSSVAHSFVGNVEELNGTGRGTPINEQCLSSLNEGDMDGSLGETSIPTENSGSTEL